jgi:nucleotide-binding universal stress UspA family protein
MRTILAAIDSSAAARAVLETALGVGELTDATVEAVHVRDGPPETAKAVAAWSHVPMRMLTGPVEQTLLRAVADPQVLAAVLGARATPGGRLPTGRTALHILERANKPVVVVPPDAVGVSPRPFKRLLVPLEGTEQSSRPLAEGLFPLIVGDVELVVVHVFTAATMPHFLNRAGRDLQVLGDEFLARYCPDATRIEWRTGPVGGRLTEASDEEGADMIALSWSQHMSAGRAAVVRDVLSHSTVPVLLLPIAGTGVQ